MSKTDFIKLNELIGPYCAVANTSLFLAQTWTTGSMLICFHQISLKFFAKKK